MDFQYDLSLAIWYLDQIDLDCPSLAPFYASLARYHLVASSKKYHFNEKYNLNEEIHQDENFNKRTSDSLRISESDAASSDEVRAVSSSSVAHR